MKEEKDLLLLILLCFTAESLCAKPVIIEEPVDKTVRQGGDVTLNCVVEHLPSDDLQPVQWTKGAFGLGNDRELSNWKRYTMVGDISIGEYNLHIEDIKVEDEDDYECQVTLHLLRSRSAKVMVLVPPVGPTIDGIKNDDLTVNVVANQENLIGCTASGGKPAAKLQWYRNGVEITDGVETVVSPPFNKLYNTSSTLRITPSADDSQASYACVMSSEAMPQVERQMMRLNVQKPPIVSVALPPTVRAGDYVRAECRAVAEPPVTSYRWFVNGSVMKDQVMSTFDVKVVDRSWNGAVIGCEAKNEAGYSERNEVTVDVKYPPQLLNNSSEQTAEIGDKVSMWCSWDSNPPPAIVWKKEGSDDVLTDGAKITLLNVTQDDAGIYVCYASAGKVGSSMASLTFNVRGPPILSSDPVQYATLGDDALLACTLKSHPGITSVTWTWRKNDRVFTLHDNGTADSTGTPTAADDDAKYRGEFRSGDRSAALRVLSADQDDLHIYSCAVQNRYGSTTMDVALSEDTTQQKGAVAMGMLLGGVLAGVVVMALVIAVAIYCIRSRRRRKSTNFDKELKNKSSQSVKGMGGNYSEDETMPINEKQDISEDYNIRSSVSSRGGIGASSVDGSDDSNPTPTSGQDDGYHTEEAHSWNRSERRTKSGSSSSPAKSSIGPYHGYVVHPLPSPPDLDQPLLNDFGSVYQDFPPRPMSPGRYGYDPGAATHSPSALRSYSALGERFSPAPMRYVHRRISDASASANSALAISPLGPDYYPTAVTGRTPVLGLPDPTAGHVPQTYGPGRRNPLIPQQVAGNERYYPAPGAIGSSQSSLDRFERGSALSASAVAGRAIDPYRSNMSSRLSQSSRSSEVLRPFTARMATHV